MNQIARISISKFGNLLLRLMRCCARRWIALPGEETPDKQLISLWLRLAQLPAGRVDPQSEAGRSLLRYWFDIQTFADIQINQVCSQYYDGKHPKHYMWLGHNRYLYDGVRKGDRVLDIGCGNSYYHQWIAEKASEVVAVDVLPERIEMARRNNEKPNVRFELMDVTRQMPEGEFDVVICSHVLEHLEDPIPILRALARNIPRLLVKVPLVDAHWMKLVKQDIGMSHFDDETHKREYTEQLLQTHLKEGGWQVTEMLRGYDLRATARSLLASDAGLSEG